MLFKGIIIVLQDNSSAVIDIANTDDLQSEPGNVERLVICVGLGTKICGLICTAQSVKTQNITVRVNLIFLFLIAFISSSNSKMTLQIYPCFFLWLCICLRKLY